MSWTWDASHFPRSVTGAMADLYCVPAQLGFANGAARYGLTLSGWQVCVEEGFVFTRLLPSVDEDEIPGREAAALESLRGRRWLADAQHWQTVERVHTLDQPRDAAAVDLGSMNLDQLADHVEQVDAVARHGVARHFELHLADMIPFGRLLLAAGQRGVPAEEVLRRCALLSPSSRITTDLPSMVPIGRVDVDAPCVDELDGLLDMATPQRAMTAPAPWGDPELDALLDEVVATFWVRDDNASLLLAAPVGLVRHALLAASERLAIDAEAIFEACLDDVASLLRGHGGPTARELQARLAARPDAAATPSTVPAVDAPVAAPSVSSRRLPPIAAGLTEALLACDELYEHKAAVGIGTDIVRGRALVATSPDQVLDAIGPGSVLVVRATSPAFDPALALVAAVVCETGGALSHAALAARELGIPAVVGLRNATELVPDGALVEVDPGEAAVRVLGA